MFTTALHMTRSGSIRLMLIAVMVLQGYLLLGSVRPNVAENGPTMVDAEEVVWAALGTLILDVPPVKETTTDKGSGTQAPDGILSGYPASEIVPSSHGVVGATRTDLHFVLRC